MILAGKHARSSILFMKFCTGHLCGLIETRSDVGPNRLSLSISLSSPRLLGHVSHVMRYGRSSDRCSEIASWVRTSNWFLGSMSASLMRRQRSTIGETESATRMVAYVLLDVQMHHIVMLSQIISLVIAVSTARESTSVGLISPLSGVSVRFQAGPGFTPIAAAMVTVQNRIAEWCVRNMVGLIVLCELGDGELPILPA